MVPSRLWNARRLVERLNKGVIVGAHLVETVGVLVCESSVSNRIKGTRWLKHNHLRTWDRGGGCVVGPDVAVGDVSDREEQSLNGVREPNVVALVRVSERGEVLSWGCLHLLDEDVSGGTSHSFTLLIGHN